MPEMRYLTPLLNERAEFVEQKGRVVRAGRRFGMILDAVDRLGFMAHAFDGLVIEVNAIDGDVIREGFGIDREAVVLRSDLDLAGFQIFDGLVRAAMAEFE